MSNNYTNKKVLVILLAVGLIPAVSVVQDGQLNKLTYDFWLGKWDAHWQNADGS